MPTPQDPLIAFLVESQKDQNETLGDVRSAVARIETRIDTWTHADATQNATLSALDSRVVSLEHDRTARDTSLKVTWAILGLIASIVGWLLNQH